MTYPPQPAFGIRDFLEQLMAYALGLVPGFLLQSFVPDGEQVGWIPLILGLVVGIGCGWLLALPLRLVVRHQQQRSLYAVIVYLYAIVWLGPLLIRFVNMGLDEAPRAPHTLAVRELHQGTKGSAKITLAHWERAAASFTVTGYAQPGTQVLVYVHPGALGFAWVELPGAAAQNERRGLVR